MKIKAEELDSKTWEGLQVKEWGKNKTKQNKTKNNDEWTID